MLKDPFIISSIILAFSFLFVLIFNHKLKSKIIKFSFLVLSLIFLILILVFDSPYIYEFLKLMIGYLWYPNYLVFVTTILISVIVLIYTLLNKKLSLKQKIGNYLLFCIMFPSYITFLRLDIDPTLYSSLYQLNSLIILRITTISFMLWLLITVIFKIMKRGNNEK